METQSDTATTVGSGDEEMHDDARRVPPWTPPATLAEAAELLASLTNDINLILAQLSEPRDAWCQRTGRSGVDYAIWRRRALLAKVHKERQLRECKRIRRRFSVNAGIAHEELLSMCRRAISAWTPPTEDTTSTVLDDVLRELAEFLVDDLSSADRGAGLLVLQSATASGAAH
jgi:hypothetical protein